MNVQLIDHFGRVYQVTGDITTIGPGKRNAIVIPEMNGEGTVLTLERNGNYWQLVPSHADLAIDLNGASTRGTQFLRDQDVVQTEGIALRFVESDTIGAQPIGNPGAIAMPDWAGSTDYATKAQPPDVSNFSQAEPQPSFPYAYAPQSPMGQPIQPMPYGNAPYGYPPKASKDKTAATFLAFLLGTVGAHHFYLGNYALGIIYLLFSWTSIPFILGIVDGIRLANLSDAEWLQKYPPTPTVLP